MDETNATPDDAARAVRRVVERIEEAAVVDREVLHAMLSAVLARGHVLLEDVPGTGKTVTARVIAEAMGLEFKRIQFTPDLLPSDVTGSTIYDEETGEFEFAKGPIFTNVVLADEINRAPPKTQAALLEAMEEGQVSVDGTTYDLPEPFLVVATQNPIEQEGTFRLPEAQRDRFSVKTSLGYPDLEGEMGLLERRANRRSLSPSVDPAVRPDAVRLLQDMTEDVTVDEKVRRYIVELARQTRADQRAEIGVSPRGVQRVFEAARAAALIDGRSYVTPDDVKHLAQSTMAHRIVLTTEATVEGVEGSAVVRHALNAVDVPAVAPGPDEPAPASEPDLDTGSEDPATDSEPSSERDSDGDPESVPGSDPNPDTGSETTPASGRGDATERGDGSSHTRDGHEEPRSDDEFDWAR
ncbi:AAA family ATPase [Natrinema salsiterrestre]|uniref:AAA family ATPase n=1 Tax=Natrinema salsiterrestre TaxID=2950540 RepID=A0A9Q4L1V4_9EURY|nr:MoxR family ATPase [Natrinema salsiterrestre]MDF9744987.1 AAA family ATPase [Natrinema salsiterrestre]